MMLTVRSMRFACYDVASPAGIDAAQFSEPDTSMSDHIQVKAWAIPPQKENVYCHSAPGQSDRSRSPHAADPDLLLVN